MFDFEFVPYRRGSGSYKWDKADSQAVDSGAYPFSVADMEFKSPEEVISAIKAFCDDGIFGYTFNDSEYCSCVKGFMQRRHNWTIEESDIVCTGGVVAALNTAVRAFTGSGEGVVIQRPVYYPFTDAIVNNGRRVVNNALLYDGKGHYSIDFDDLEEKLSRPENTLMLLCSPHNPVGRVWTPDELRQVGELCLKNDVVLISDEIHFDLTKAEHTVMNCVDERFKSNTLVCTAVSKSFNLAGLGTANIIIQEDKLRQRFKAQLTADGYSCINCLSRPATIAAYTQCDAWLDAVNAEIDKNFKLLEDFCSEHKNIILSQREGTYLAWLDMRSLGFSDEELNNFMINACSIIPDPGFWFGEEGRGFTRLNLALPEEILKSALEKMDKAIDNRLKQL